MIHYDIITQYNAKVKHSAVKNKPDISGIFVITDDFFAQSNKLSVKTPAKSDKPHKTAKKTKNHSADRYSGKRPWLKLSVK